MALLPVSPNLSTILPMFDLNAPTVATWQVGDLTRYIRELFDIDYRLQAVRVAGEISNFVRARSGHLYFTLKDSEAQLKCVMWRSSAEKLAFRPSNGDAVVARGRVSVYESGGVYQLYADRLEPAGRGNLAIQFEQLKQQLLAQGLFDAEHKQEIPTFPRKIGIVTSADAAALQDILNVLRRRFPLVSVLIAPTLVQGDLAPQQIVRALQWLDGREDIDTIIVARGGGSMEDLWAFNDERVARAMFAARHPLISGVGHEVDFTIADFVADLRAPTPSAAAELAVPDISEFVQHITYARKRLTSTINSLLEQRQRFVDTLARELHTNSPQARIENDVQRLDNLGWRLHQATNRQLSEKRSQLAVMQAQLNAVSPMATLSRGYAIVRHPEYGVVRSLTQVADGDKLDVQVADGKFAVTVTE